MNAGAFIVLTQLSGFDEKLRSIDDFTGLALKRPVLSALFGFFLISLIGIPFTGGFFGKFYAFSAAVHGDHTWLAVVGLANSGVACFYYLRLLAALYSRPLTDEAANTPAGRVTIPAALALTATALATLGLGILPNHVLHLVQRATPQTLPALTAAPIPSILPPYGPDAAAR
jgi:NADH-quinone oxidoreductase subunit N